MINDANLKLRVRLEPHQAILRVQSSVKIRKNIYGYLKVDIGNFCGNHCQ